MSSLKNKKNRALKMMMWFGIGSLFMTFAGLSSAFIVSKNRQDWIVNFELPDAFYYSLFLIILSSVSIVFARKFIYENRIRKSSTLLTITIVLGTLFVIFQIIGFTQIMDRGYHFTGPTSSVNSSFIFLIAFVHILHVIVGIFALTFVLFKNLRGLYIQDKTGFDLASIFWHFVDILWIYLFLFLVFFG